MSQRRFVILDRDGTLIVKHHYLHDPGQVELLPGAAAALRDLAAMGLGLVVVTNQSGISRGYFDQDDLMCIHARMTDLLAEQGVRLDAIYHCPHHPDDHCACRKPATGLALMAARDLGFLPHQSFVIGDDVCDVGLGRNLGAVTILVRTGEGAALELRGAARADYHTDGLGDAAKVVRQQLAMANGAGDPSGTASAACPHAQSAVSWPAQISRAGQHTADSAVRTAPLAVPLPLSKNSIAPAA